MLFAVCNNSVSRRDFFFYFTILAADTKMLTISNTVQRSLPSLRVVAITTSHVISPVYDKNDIRCAHMPVDTFLIIHGNTETKGHTQTKLIFRVSKDHESTEQNMHNQSVHIHSVLFLPILHLAYWRDMSKITLHVIHLNNVIFFHWHQTVEVIGDARRIKFDNNFCNQPNTNQS